MTMQVNVQSQQNSGNNNPFIMPVRKKKYGTQAKIDAHNKINKGMNSSANKVLASHIGEQPARFLQHLLYIQNIPGGREVNGKHYNYNSYDDWARILGISVSTVKRAIATLRSLGLIETMRINQRIKMNFHVRHDTLDALLKKLGTDGKPDTFMISKARSELTPTCSLLLHKLGYWWAKGMGKRWKGKRYMFNTPTEWFEQIGRKRHSFYISLKTLEREGFIEVDRTYGLLYIHLNTKKCIENGYFEEDAFKICPLEKDGPTLEIDDPTSLNTKTENTEKRGMDIKNEPQKAVITDEEKHTTTQMIQIWNEEVGEHRQDTFVLKNPPPIRYCSTAMRYMFDGDMEKWRRYCRTIKGSPQLMQPSWLLTMAWALEFNVIKVILKGEWGSPLLPMPIVKGEDEKLQAALNSISMIDEGETQKKMRRAILRKYGATLYNAWMDRIMLIGDKGGGMGPAFALNKIETLFAELFEKWRKRGYLPEDGGEE